MKEAHVESLTYLTRSLDVQVVEPFQHCNSGHHPNGRVMKVAVQHLNYPIQVQGHLDPLGAAWKGERGWVSAAMSNSLLPRRGGLQHTTGYIKTSQLKPQETSTVPLGLLLPHSAWPLTFLILRIQICS